MLSHLPKGENKMLFLAQVLDGFSLLAVPDFIMVINQNPGVTVL